VGEDSRSVSTPGEETVGQRIRRLRLEHGLSQPELAGPGVSSAYLSRIENSTRKPSLKAIRHIANKLGVDPHYIETGEPIDPLTRIELEISDAELALRIGSHSDEALEVAAANAGAEARDLSPALAARASAVIGLIAYKGGRHDYAITQLERVTESGHLTVETRPDVWQALGAAYMAAGRMRDAADLWEGVLDSLDQERAAPLIVRFNAYLAWAYSEMGMADRARPALAAATELAEDEQVIPQVRVSVLWEQARQAWQEEDGRAALVHMRRAVAVLETTEDTHALGRAHLTCAQFLSMDGDPEAIAVHLDRAESLLGKQAEREELGVLRAERSKLAARAGDARLALRLAQEAAELFGGDARHIGLREHTLGFAYASGDDLDSARPHYESAIEDASARGQWREAASITHELARLLRDAGKQKEALDAFDRAAELGDKALGKVARR
jgi:transcriptional regulator with XRE-family HTH domain